MANRTAPATAIRASATVPYFEWTYKVQGRTVNVKPSPQAAPLYQAATKQHRKLKAVLARMERLSRTALARLARQAEKTE